LRETLSQRTSKLLEIFVVREPRTFERVAIFKNLMDAMEFIRDV